MQKQEKFEGEKELRKRLSDALTSEKEYREMLAASLKTSWQFFPEVMLAARREEWLAVGRSCASLNRPRVARIVGELYGRLGKATPVVLFLDSPMSCMMTCALLRDQLGDQLHGQLWDQLRSQLSDQLRGQLWDQLSDQLRDQLRAYLCGNLWCAWEAFYAAAGEIVGGYESALQNHLDLWCRQAREMHLWWPYSNVALISERPRKLHLDQEGKLHHETDLAIEYADGWGIFAQHGVRQKS